MNCYSLQTLYPYLVTGGACVRFVDALPLHSFSGPFLDAVYLVVAVDFVIPPRALKVEVEVGKGLSRVGSGSKRQSLYLQPAGARGRHTPEHPPPPPPAQCRGAQQHTGQLTCFDLSSALGPWDPGQ